MNRNNWEVRHYILEERNRIIEIIKGSEWIHPIVRGLVIKEIKCRKDKQTEKLEEKSK